jgi:hypothetical protein
MHTLMLFDVANKIARSEDAYASVGIAVLTFAEK